MVNLGKSYVYRWVPTGSSVTLVGRSQQMVTQPNCANRTETASEQCTGRQQQLWDTQNFDRGSVQCWDVKKSLVDKVQWHSRFRNDRDFKVAEEKSFAVVQEESKAAELV